MNTTSQEMKLIVINGQVIETSAQFTPKIGKDIGYEKGAKMIKRHIDANPDDVIGQFLGREIIEKLLAQPNVVGLRTFYALNELGIRRLVFVGVDKNGKNILEIKTQDVNGEVKITKGIVADGAGLCPKMCGSGNGTSIEEEFGWQGSL